MFHWRSRGSVFENVFVIWSWVQCWYDGQDTTLTSRKHSLDHHTNTTVLRLPWENRFLTTIPVVQYFDCPEKKSRPYASYQQYTTLTFNKTVFISCQHNSVLTSFRKHRLDHHINTADLWLPRENTVLTIISTAVHWLPWVKTILTIILALHYSDCPLKTRIWP